MKKVNEIILDGVSYEIEDKTANESIAAIDSKLENLKDKDASIEDSINSVISTTQQLQTKLNTLNGNGEGSIKSIVEKEVKNITTVDPEVFDTIENVSDWMENDTTGSAALIQEVSEISEKLDETCTVRFDRIQESEVSINTGVADTVKEIVYYKPTNKFIVTDNSGNYWDTWNGMEAYMSGGKIREDKLFLYNSEVYMWDNSKLSSITDFKVLSINFDKTSYLDLSGTTDNNASAWRSTNYISVLPNQRIKYRGIGQFEDTLLIAFYDINKKFISGIAPKSETFEVEDIDTIIPDNTFYIKACTTINPSFYTKPYYLLVFPEENNNIIGDFIAESKVKNKLRAYDCDLNSKSFRRDGKDIIINSYNNNVSSTYSSLLLYKNNLLFANIRANNIVLSSNMLAILSKKENEVDRFNSIEEIPHGSPDSNVYLVPVNFAGVYENSWDIVIGNFDGNINSFMNNNFKLYADNDNEGIKAEYFNNGLIYKNSDLFPEEYQGYLNLYGEFISTPAVKWFTSDFIEVYEGQRLKGKGYGQRLATPLVAMYDAKKNYIADFSILSTNENGKVEEFDVYIKKGVRYVRILKFGDSESYIIESSRYCSTIKEDKEAEIKLKYSHSLKKPYNFEGKTAKFFGDSVTWGVSTNPWTSPLTNCYRKLFCDMAGLTAANEAVSGSYIFDPEYDMDTPKTSSILSQIKNKVVDDSQDFIFVAGGINDFWTGKTLGNINDEGHISFYGALKEICNHIKNIAPSANVIFLTPINYSRIGGDSPVAELNAYRNAISEIAVINGFSVVDTSVIPFPNEKVPSLYRTAIIEDGVHPTALGHKMMAENLYSILGE